MNEKYHYSICIDVIMNNTELLVFRYTYGKGKKQKKKYVTDRNRLLVGDYDYIAFRYVYSGIILYSNYN